MKEIQGELWDFYADLARYRICITTNGTVKRDGRAVMGRGCAAEAKQKFPGIDGYLGDLITKNGNHFDNLPDPYFLYVFPVKHNWWEVADLDLIRMSAQALSEAAVRQRPGAYVGFNFILPRPGCGNGHRSWEEVKPLLEDLPDNVWVISKPEEAQ